MALCLTSYVIKQGFGQLQLELNIPTICQRLFYQGQELHDNAATVLSLNIAANDLLELRKENESLESESDSGERTPKDEGRGFGGTLLAGGARPSSSPDKDIQRAPEEKSCSACTFANQPSALSCTICDTLFI